MISNGLLVFFFEQQQKLVSPAVLSKTACNLSKFRGKKLIFYSDFFEFFAVLEHQTLEFRQHDNRRVSKTLLSVATGTF